MLESTKIDIKRIESERFRNEGMFDSRFTKVRQDIEDSLKIFFFDKSGRIPLKSIQAKHHIYTIHYKQVRAFTSENDTITFYLYNNYSIEKDYVNMDWCEKWEIKRKLEMEAFKRWELAKKQ